MSYKSACYFSFCIDLIGSSVDFDSEQFNITINSGETTGYHDLSITCDKLVETDESFNLTFALAVHNDQIIIGQSTAAVQIVDSTGTVQNS